MILYYFILNIGLALLVNVMPKKQLTIFISLLCALFQTALSIYAFLNLNQTDLVYFTYDAAGFLFLLVLNFLVFGTLFYGFAYLRDQSKARFNLYHSALIILFTAITGAYLANDLTVVWIFVEATTLAASVLIYHHRDDMALEATWKYIFICSSGIALAYIGVLLLSASIQSGHEFNLSFENLRDGVKNASPIYLKMAFLMVLVGYSTKMELFPMHTVGIDANTVAPSPISGLISTAMVNMGFLSIFRVYEILASTSILTWMNNVLIIAGVASLIVSSAYLLQVRNLKRMFAYSSLENAGIVAIALGVGGFGYIAAFLHLIIHSFVKSSLFFQSGKLYQVYQTFDIKKMGGLFRIYPVYGILLLSGTIALIALPPSGLFISEMLTFKALYVSGKIWVFVLVAILLCFALYAIVTNLLHVLYAPFDKELKLEKKVSKMHLFFQLIFLGIVAYFCFVQPQLISDLINLSIQNLPK